MITQTYLLNNAHIELFIDGYSDNREIIDLKTCKTTDPKESFLMNYKVKRIEKLLKKNCKKLNKGK